LCFLKVARMRSKYLLSDAASDGRENARMVSRKGILPIRSTSESMMGESCSHVKKQ
jgi:hypothetical protein